MRRRSLSASLARFRRGPQLVVASASAAWAGHLAVLQRAPPERDEREQRARPRRPVRGNGARATVKANESGADEVRSFVKARASTAYAPGGRFSITNWASPESLRLSSRPSPARRMKAYWNCSGKVRVESAATSSARLFCG